jgi:hypothetical protein
VRRFMAAVCQDLFVWDEQIFDVPSSIRTLTAWRDFLASFGNLRQFWRQPNRTMGGCRARLREEFRLFQPFAFLSKV